MDIRHGREYRPRMSNLPAARFLDRTTPPHIITLILLAGVSALSMNVFLPSLPNMSAHFGVDYAVMQLSIAAYLGFNAALQVVLGPLSDRYGRRPIVLSGFAIFTVASIGCAVAPNAEVFLTFRMIQAGVVVGMVLSRAAIRDMVPPNQAASMMGYVTMGMTIVPMLGPTLGGILDENFGWAANFWVLSVAGLVTLIVVWRDMGETATQKSASFAEQFRQYPELVKSPRFWGYCLTSTFGGAAFFSYLGGAPFVGSAIYDLSPSTFGIYFSVPALGYFSGNFAVGRFAVRLGIDRMILAGALILAGAMLMVTFLFMVGVSHVLVFFGFMYFVGLGNGMVIPNATAGMLSVRPHLAGSAAGLGGMIAIGGGAAMSGYAGSILTPETGAMPLLLLMLSTSIISAACILYVIRRTRILGLSQDT